VIIAPDGAIVAGPVREKEETLVADLDLGAVLTGRQNGPGRRLQARRLPGGIRWVLGGKHWGTGEQDDTRRPDDRRAGDPLT
jgi:hypothetical protein